MVTPIRILLQTTIPATADDWSIDRFSMLRDYLATLQAEDGSPLCHVVARDREADAAGNDPILSTLGTSDFDELWLFAVDVGDGLSPLDAEGIAAFHRRGGGILATRDHQDLGCSLANLSGIGTLHFFHTINPDPDPSRHCCDDTYTATIQWPNYHSGANGNYQRIKPLEPLHPLLVNPDAPSGVIEFLPAHPHEGAVGAAEGEANARAIAVGTSLTTGREFALAIAVDRTTDADGHILGRVVAESTFHHFCDYNWDARAGAPSFVDEPPGDTMQTEPRALADTHAYMRNLVLWLAGAL